MELVKEPIEDGVMLQENTIPAEQVRKLNIPKRANDTNQTLMTYYEELVTGQQSIFSRLLSGKINEFRRRNDQRYLALCGKIMDLRKDMFEFNEDGSVKTIGEGEEQKVVFKGEFKMEDYDKAFGELMRIEIYIEF